MARIRAFLGIPALQNALIATWYKVGYYDRRVDKLNTFQVVLTWYGTESYVCYFYEQLQWTMGGSSGGIHAVAGLSGLAPSSFLF